MDIDRKKGKKKKNKSIEPLSKLSKVVRMHGFVVYIDGLIDGNERTSA